MSRGQQAAPATLARPFIAGTRRQDKPDYDQTVTMTSAEQRLPSYQLAPNGFLRGIYLIVEGTAVNTTASTVAYNENGPFNVISNITLNDTSNAPLVGPMSGYDLYVLNKYGGYSFQDDAKNSPIYSATTGTTSTAGTFAFVLFVPVEIVGRDAFGALPNVNAAATYSLNMFVAALATVYSDDPTTSVSVRVRTVLAGWQDPANSDVAGTPTAQEPIANLTTQYWQKQQLSLASGSVTRRLETIVGLVRNIIFINYRASSTRATGDSDWPDPFTLKYEGVLLVESRPKILWRHWIARNFGYSAAAEAANGRDNGVYPIWDWMNDFGPKPGWEKRFVYLPASAGTNIEVQGSWGGAATLDVLVNTVNPFPQGDVMAITGER